MQKILTQTISWKHKCSTFRNILSTCLRKAEESYDKDLITSRNQNLHKHWNYLCKIINPPKQKSQNKISKLIFRDKINTDDQEIVNIMNEHFNTIGENLVQKLNSTGHSAPNSFRQYMKNENPNNFLLYPTDAE